jgi:hypothetical protein
MSNDLTLAQEALPPLVLAHVDVNRLAVTGWFGSSLAYIYQQLSTFIRVGHVKEPT